MLDLFIKEIQEEKNWFWGLALAILGINLLFLPLASVSEGVSASLALLFTLPAFPLYIFIKSFQLYKDEWDLQTGFILFSLPVRGYKIVLAKLGALTLEILLYLFLAFFIPFIILSGYSHGAYGIEGASIIKLWLTTSVTTLLIIPFPTFAYLFGRMFSRFRNWITTATLIVIFIIYIKYLPFGRAIFDFLPPVSFNLIIWEEINTITTRTSSMFATFLFDILLLWGSSYFIEKKEL
ncbi:hypothetical protein KAW18_04470 [candidate division WOR-3 bacterium]|nr:hypothetical protein [candidate division WOR-3 bacterium]MCK4526604.1 hypothetical protein [candidate division WOR-3 bacterium]